MSPQKTFIISLVTAIIAVGLLLMYDPRSAPFLPATIFLFCFTTSVTFFIFGIGNWFKGRRES